MARRVQDKQREREICKHETEHTSTHTQQKLRQYKEDRNHDNTCTKRHEGKKTKHTESEQGPGTGHRL